jgi:hypothetical protein
MTAGDHAAAYRGGSGDGLVGDLATRAVLRELCRIAHDAGVAEASVATLARRVGISERTCQYALARLQRDGLLRRPVRGTGNRHGSAPRGSVWVLARLPDDEGRMRPDVECVARGWAQYLRTRRWERLGAAAREAVRDARHAPPGPVDNSPAAALLAASGSPTSGKYSPHIHKEETQEAQRAALRVVPPLGG